jgi:hypothetical protein
VKKPKKITIKPFLNDNLEKIEMSISEGGGEGSGKEYGLPLYYMVIYNRNNTKIKSRLGFYYTKDEEIPEGIIQHEPRIIEQILRYLISINGEEVNLKGLGRVFDNYSQDLWGSIEKYLKNKLRLASMSADSWLSCMINYDDWRNNFTRYYEIALQIFKGISSKIDDTFRQEIEAYNVLLKIKDRVNNSIEKNYSPAIIDWLYGSYKSVMLKELEGWANKHDVTKLIDSALEKYIEK